jgi:hypothetical protein
MRYKPLKWAYGVTTCPARRDTLLPETLLSLRNAGFDRPRLFVDGTDDPMSWEREFGLPVTGRNPTVRVYGNWVLGLAELYLRAPESDRFAMFQDDLMTCRNVREFLDRSPYPIKGYMNLFTYRDNENLIRGKEPGWYESNQWGRGALALVFDRPTLLTLLTHQHMVDRPLDVHRGWRAIDGGIVTAMKKAGYKEFVHAPSLVQHTGLYSSMGNKPHPVAHTFPGESHDALAFLESPAVPTGLAPAAV